MGAIRRSRQHCNRHDRLPSVDTECGVLVRFGFTADNVHCTALSVLERLR